QRQETPARDESHQREVHLLLARQRDGRRAALDVRLVLDDCIHAFRRGERYERHLEVREFQLVLHGRGNALAQVDRIACRLTRAVVEGEGQGVGAIPDADFSRLLDLVERAGEGKRREHAGYEGQEKSGRETTRHGYPQLLLAAPGASLTQPPIRGATKI